jgi:hypothetical protein
MKISATHSPPHLASLLPFNNSPESTQNEMEKEAKINKALCRESGSGLMKATRWLLPKQHNNSGESFSGEMGAEEATAELRSTCYGNLFSASTHQSWAKRNFSSFASLCFEQFIRVECVGVERERLWQTTRPPIWRVWRRFLVATNT